MKKQLFLLVLFCFFVPKCSWAQDSLALKAKDTIKTQINVLAPSKAAFYSAIVPGLGQAYNKKYWKIPIVLGAMGASLYYYSWNNTKYHEFRDEYKDRLSGENKNVDTNLDDLPEATLIRGQRFHQKNRDLSLLLTFGFYILNIVDANVDAHLMQFNVSDDLSIKPDVEFNTLQNKHNFGLTVAFRF